MVLEVRALQSDKCVMAGGRIPKQRGTRFEYYIREILTDAGYQVKRSYGSLGPYDLLAEREGFPTLMIQCKFDKAIPKERAWNALYHLAEQQHAIPLLATRFHGHPRYLRLMGLRAFRQRAKTLLKPYNPFGQQEMDLMG